MRNQYSLRALYNSMVGSNVMGEQDQSEAKKQHPGTLPLRSSQFNFIIWDFHRPSAMAPRNNLHGWGSEKNIFVQYQKRFHP